MKSAFSNQWNSSTQIRKQRKYRYNAPLHIKNKFLNVHLDKDLRKKYGTRSIRIRKGDEVKIMLGKFKGKSGKVTFVNAKNEQITIDGMQNKKKDGTKINAFFNASNLMITQLNVDDKKRFKRINLSKDSKKVEKEEEKPKTTEVKKISKKPKVTKEENASEKINNK